MIHNAFKTGNVKFGQRALDLSLDVHQWFHMFPAREEDNSELKTTMENQDETDTKTFLRHVDSRWLTLLPAVQRIHKQLPLLKKYFKEFLPKNDKRIQKNVSFKRIHEILSEELQLEVELCFLEDVKPVFDKYLTVLQTEGPLIHVQYPSLLELMKTFLGRFMRQDQIPSPGSLVACNDTSVKNQLGDKDLVLGMSTRRSLAEMKPEKKMCLLVMRNFFSTAADYLKTHLPLNDSLLKAVVIAHPEYRQRSSAMDRLKILCQKLPCEGNELAAMDEWKLCAEDTIPAQWVELSVDQYWAKISGMKSVARNTKYLVLASMMKCALTLVHGNADTERNLSENKKFLTKEKSTLSPQTLIGLSLTKDAINALGHGDPNEVPISRQMLKRCKGACTEYECELKERREQELCTKKEKEEVELAKRQEGGRTTEARESNGNQGEKQRSAYWNWKGWRQLKARRVTLKRIEGTNG